MSKHTRTLIIPKGILDGNVTNVVMIPSELEDPNQSLIVRAPGHDRSMPVIADRAFIDYRPRRVATSLHGTPARPPQPDYYERDFDVPIGASTFQEEMDDDYCFDMYDSDNDEFVGGSSGDLSGSAMQNLLGGEHNRISGAEQAQVTHESLQPAPFMIESPISSYHDSVVDSAGYDASEDPYIMSNYTPLSQSISVPAADYMWPPLPNCGPCYPPNGNYDLCPDTCPVRRGIPFGDPNRPAEEFSQDEEFEEEISPYVSSAPQRTGPILAGTPSPLLDRTRSPGPTPFLNVTRSALNRTGPVITSALNTTGPVVRPVNLNQTRPVFVDLNRTHPMAGVDLNVTRPMGADLNVTRPMGVDLNVTRPMGVNLNVTRPMGVDLNVTRPMSVGARILNTTGPVISPSASRINLNVTVELQPSTVVPPSVSRSRLPLPMNPATPMVQRAIRAPFTGVRGPPQQRFLQVPATQPQPRRQIPFPQRQQQGQQRPRQLLPPRQPLRPRSATSRGSCKPCSGRPPWRP